VTDRDSYREMEDIIDSGWADLIVVEYLGRIAPLIRLSVLETDVGFFFQSQQCPC
jgi:hypothetical protein